MTRDDGPPFEIAVYRSAQRVCICFQLRFKSVGQTTRAPEQSCRSRVAVMAFFANDSIPKRLHVFGPISNKVNIRKTRSFSFYRATEIVCTLNVRVEFNTYPFWSRETISEVSDGILMDFFLSLLIYRIYFVWTFGGYHSHPLHYRLRSFRNDGRLFSTYINSRETGVVTALLYVNK